MPGTANAHLADRWLLLDDLHNLRSAMPTQNSIPPTRLREISNGLTERDRADIAQMEDGLPAGWIVAFRQHRGAIFQGEWVGYVLAPGSEPKRAAFALLRVNERVSVVDQTGGREDAAGSCPTFHCARAAMSMIQEVIRKRSVVVRPLQLLDS